MTAHAVKFSTHAEVEVLHTDYEFKVRAGGAPLGTLKISKGTIDWLPA
jgi:hypothetical protein